MNKTATAGILVKRKPMSLLKRSREGYLLVDHRDSPGVPEAMIQVALKAGKSVPSGIGAGTFYESATVTCCHCNSIVILNPNRKRPRGYCAKCDRYVCDNPRCGLECNPFRRLIDGYGGLIGSTPFSNFTTF